MKNLIRVAILAFMSPIVPMVHAQDLLQLKCPYGRNDLGKPADAVAGLVTVNFGARTMRVDFLDAGDNVTQSTGDRAARISEDSISMNVGGNQGADHILNRYTGTLTSAVYDGSPSKLRVTWNCERHQRGERRF